MSDLIVDFQRTDRKVFSEESQCDVSPKCTEPAAAKPCWKLPSMCTKPALPPCRHELTRKEKVRLSTSPVPLPTMRRVRFAPKSNLRFYERQAEAYRGELYCTPEDYKIYKKGSQIEVQGFRRKLLISKKTGPTTKEDSEALFRECNLVGVEHLLTPDLIRKIVARKASRVAAVLEEQRRQNESGLFDPHAIAEASLQHSKRAAQRARKVGTMQSMM